MKKTLLILTHFPRPIDISDLFSALEDYFEVEKVTFDPGKKGNIAKSIKKVELEKYDHVLVDLPFKRIYQTPSLFSQVKNLTIYEEDAYQDNLPHSKWCGKFMEFYKSLPQLKVVNTGYATARHFQNNGVHAHTIPKGFSKNRIKCQRRNRDIPIGFIGSLKSKVYDERRQFISAMMNEFGMLVLRTSSYREYCEYLNRFEIFFGADVGMGEYMCKNFEAMSCGSLLATYDLGQEAADLGLKDMKNVVLYKTLEEAKEKVRYLLSHKAMLLDIAEAGRALAFENHEFSNQGRLLARYVQEAPPRLADKLPGKPSFWSRFL